MGGHTSPPFDAGMRDIMTLDCTCDCKELHSFLAVKMPGCIPGEPEEP